MNLEKLINHKTWLAPLAGITDYPYRKICKIQGADVMVSEMVSADGIVFDSIKTMEYILTDNSQKPFGIQLFGSKPDIMAKALEILIKKEPDFVDINMGCPVKKVVKRGAGSALMNNPENAQNIVKQMKSVLKGSNVVLTVKFRAGWDLETVCSTDFGKRMEDAGADIVCLHPRTRSQMFSGRSNWDLIKDLKNAVSIPVVGNGDIANLNDALDMYEKTGCDSVMIGRGIMGNPWLFKEISSFFLTGKKIEITNKVRYETVKKHMELMINSKGEERAVREMRTHFCHYTKGFRGGKKVRDYINHTLDSTKILKVMKELYEGNTKSNLAG